MTDEARLPLVDDPSVPAEVRRLLVEAPGPRGISDTTRRNAWRALVGRRRSASTWRAGLAVAFASLLLVGVAVGASKAGWSWQSSRRPELRAKEKSPDKAEPRPSTVASLTQVQPAPPPVAVDPPVNTPSDGKAVDSMMMPGPRKASEVLPAPPTASLEAEVAALREARVELATDPGHALALSRNHGKRFPAARLGAEASLLEVEALVRLGRRDEAQRVGQRLLGASGASLYRERLESLLGSASFP